ncbi:MAG: MerR family DNA-binding transcriptional regulator [Pseudomonadota bacterium]
MDAVRLSFKEMCARFDVTPRTLRYYEYIELLSPERDGRSRWYSSREVARMTLILRGRRWGFSLEEIRQWLEMRETRGDRAQLEGFLALADRQLGTLAEQRTELEETIAELESMRAEVAADLGAPPTAVK